MTAGPFLALAAALGFAVARVVLKRALPHTTPLTGVVVSIIFTGSVLLIVAALTTPLAEFAATGVWPFVIAGLLAPERGKLLVYVGIDRIVAARSSAVMPIGPFSAILLAVAFLGERPSGSLLIGASSGGHDTVVATGGGLSVPYDASYYAQMAGLTSQPVLRP
jgi:drug/metabolite transporter (DMT)-like permease